MQHKLCSAASSVAYRCCSPPWAFPPKLGPLSGAAPFGGQTIISHPFAGWPAVMAAFCSCRLKETHMSAPLLSLAEDTALLALEAQTVIGIRLTQLSLGGSAAGAEAQRMVTEKVSAFAEAAALLASGGSAHEVVKGYRAGQAPDGVAVVNGSVNVLGQAQGAALRNGASLMVE